MKYFGIALFITVLILFFQNCDGSFESNKSTNDIFSDDFGSKNPADASNKSLIIKINNDGETFSTSDPILSWEDSEASLYPNRKYDIYVLNPSDGSKGDLGASVQAPIKSKIWNINRALYPNGEYTLRLYWSDVDWAGHPNTSEYIDGKIQLDLPINEPSEKGKIAIGLPFIAWSLQDQRMKDDKIRVAWSFKAKRTETLTEMTIIHRVATSGTGYSAGNGGTVKYRFHKGTIQELGALIYESGTIVGNTRLYGPRPQNTVQPTREVSNPSYQPFPIEVPVLEGDFYTIIVERQSSVSHHMSVNTYIIPDEDRDVHNYKLGLLSPIEWKIHVQAKGSSTWKRRENQIAIFGLGNSQGVSYGNLFMEELAAPEPDRLYNLSGNKRFRWNLKLPAPFKVVKLALGLVRRSGSQPVIIDIKNSSGDVLVSKSLDFSKLSIPGNNTSGLADNDWALRQARFVEVDININLPSEQLYFEVSTGSSTNFEIAGSRDAVDSGIYKPREIDNGYMEISSNGGSSWSLPQQWAQKNVKTVQPTMYIYGEFTQ